MRIEKWDDEKVLFSDGSVLKCTHKPDCCEYNYADFSILDVMYDGVEFSDWSLELVNLGVNLVLHFDSEYRNNHYWRKKRIYVPFYSSQNGYYSTEVDLIILNKAEVRLQDLEAFYYSDEDNEDDFHEEADKQKLHSAYCRFCHEGKVFNSMQAMQKWTDDHIARCHRDSLIAVDTLRGGYERDHCRIRHQLSEGNN